MLTLPALLLLSALASHPSTVAFELPERDLFPESIAHDAADGSFYVGSMYRRKIVRIASDGKISDFTASKQDGLWGLLGMKIDPKRRELWANVCNLGPKERPPMIDPDAATAGKAALYRYDLRTGKLIQRYVAVEPPAALCFNDLVLSGAGDIYLSSGPAGVWRLKAGGSSIEKFHAAGEHFGNGIALSPDGRQLFLAVHDKGVAAIDTSTKEMRYLGVPEGPHIMGIDGLYVHDGALVGVQNGTRTIRIVRAPLSKDLTRVERVEILEEAHPRFEVPTTGVIVGNALYYVATSQLDSVDPKTNEIPPLEKLKPNVILRLELPARVESPR